MTATRRKKSYANSHLPGCGQLSLVEHALCPLDPRLSLRTALVHAAHYRFLDAARHWRTAQAQVFCPLGLSAHDEFFLWGLLALTLAEPQPQLEFHATPHFCLRRWGKIDPSGRRGGRQYQQFAAAIERLAVVRYVNDAFYDPIRAEQRRVSFGFFSYSLPHDRQSSRAWRFYWDPLFFELVTAHGGALRFDLELYRQLDPAARRLFLLVAKIFPRRRAITLELSQLAVQVLGLSPTLITRDQLAKTKRCVRVLQSRGVLASDNANVIRKQSRGAYTVTLRAGPATISRKRESNPGNTIDSSLAAFLTQVGLDLPTCRFVLQRYPALLLREWADITLAARERFGDSFFKRNPVAYLLDNLKHASQGQRTPPDWWHEVRKAEERLRSEQLQSRLAPATTKATTTHSQPQTSRPLTSIGQVLASLVPISR